MCECLGCSRSARGLGFEEKVTTYPQAAATAANSHLYAVCTLNIHSQRLRFVTLFGMSDTRLGVIKSA